MRIFFLLSQEIYPQNSSCEFLISGGSKSWKIARFEIVEDEWGNPIDFEQFNDEYVLMNDTLVDSYFSQGLYIVNESNDTLLLGFYHCSGDNVVYSPYVNSEVSLLLQPLSFYQDGVVLNMLASVGDTIMTGFNDIGGEVSIVVEDVDTVTYLDGIPRRRSRVKDVQYFGDIVVSELPDPLYFVQGIGNTFNGLHLQFRRQFNDWTKTRELICYYENGNLVYFNDNYLDNGCDSENYAQVDSIYVPFLSGNLKRWYLMNFDFEMDTSTSVLYNYGDTIIDSKIFEKFYINNTDFIDAENWYDSGVYTGAFREQGQKIYFKHPSNANHDENIPIVDFTVGVGDTIYRYIDKDNVYWFGIVTSRFDRSFDDGVQRTRYTHLVCSMDLSDPNSVFQEEYIESLTEGILIIQPSFSGSLFRTIFDRDTTEHVQCFYENDFQVFHSEYVFTDDLPCYYNGLISSTSDIQAIEKRTIILYPNPTLDEISILYKDSNAFVNVEISSVSTGIIMDKHTINLGGKLSVENLPRGSYIMKIIFSDGVFEQIKFLKL